MLLSISMMHVHQKNHHEKRQLNSKTFFKSAKTITGANLIACDEESMCRIITEFNINNKSLEDCHNKFLEIEFELIDSSTNNSVISTGFLTGKNTVVFKQEKSNFCMKIKRYSIKNWIKFKIFYFSLTFISQDIQ